MPDEPVLFTLQMEVRVWGPDAEWDDVPGKLERRLEGLKIAGGYTIGRATRDTTAETDAT